MNPAFRGNAPRFGRKAPGGPTVKTVHVFAFSARAFYPIVSAVQPPNSEEIRSAVRLALAEDIGAGDVTSLATVPETRRPAP